MAQFRRLTCLGAVLITTIAGCGKQTEVEDPDTLPFVQCTIEMGGQIVENAVVALHAAGGPSIEIVGNYDPESSCYRFVTKEGGTKKAGVPEGDYTMTVTGGRNTSAKIPAVYSDPAKSDLKATITKGKNFLPEFELKK